jgi:hypothetical protein
MGPSMLLNVVNSIVQGVQHNIVHGCRHQPRTGCAHAFLPVYRRKNAQVDAILMKTGLNNVLLPTLFIAVNNIEQYCYT